MLKLLVLGFLTIAGAGGTFSVVANNGGHGEGSGKSHGAPAPELGAGVLGMLLAGGIAAYLNKRRRV